MDHKLNNHESAFYKCLNFFYFDTYSLVQLLITVVLEAIIFWAPLVPSDYLHGSTDEPFMNGSLMELTRQLSNLSSQLLAWLLAVIPIIALIFVVTPLRDFRRWGLVVDQVFVGGFLASYLGLLYLLEENHFPLSFLSLSSGAILAVLVILEVLIIYRMNYHLYKRGK